MKRYFAIGDLHGHYDLWLKLYDQLLHTANLKPEEDTLVFLGDYVDGGPQVKQLLDWLMEYKQKYPHWQMLFGNHEDLMLDALVRNGAVYGSYDLWWGQGGRETYQSFLPDTLTGYEKAISQVKDHITSDYLHFLVTLPFYFETDDYFFVHAGLVPGMSIEEHKRILHKGATEGAKLKKTVIWIRDEFINSEYDWGKKIIFGHTATHMPIQMNNKIGIDGMFHNTGKLFALELPVERIYAVYTGDYDS